MSEWVLRLDSSDDIALWWCGPGRLASPLLDDALRFETPDDVRAAMAAVGWAPTRPGWITPMRLAVERAKRSQLALFAV